MQVDCPETIIRYLDTRYNEDANTNFLRIYVSCCMTEDIRKVQDWGEPAHGSPKGALSGELKAITMTMVPKAESMKHHAFSMDISEVRDFTYKCEDDENGNRRRTRLDFIIMSSGLEQFSKFGAYYFAVGNSESKMTVSFHKQEEIDLDAGKRIEMGPVISGKSLFDAGPIETAVLTEDTAGCANCDAGMDLLDDGQHHIDGSVCPIAKRNAAVQEKPEPEPMGRFAPSAFGGGTAADAKKRRKEEEARKKELAGGVSRGKNLPADPGAPDWKDTARDTAPEV